MSDEVEIPPIAWEAKPLFPTRPGEDVIAEIKTFVKRTGTPYLWRGHTHSPPPQDAQIVYLDEVSLPPSHSGDNNRDRWSPCPICSPRHPKFYKAGMIAWFPEEQTIRIIGPECFASFNLEGHAEAFRAFQKEQEERKNTAFLLSHLGQVGEAIAVLKSNFPTIKAIDRVREIIARRLPVICDFDFWAHIRSDQTFKIEEKRRTFIRNRNGEEEEITTRHISPYGPVVGHMFLQPKAKLIYDQLDICRTRLKMCDFGEKFADHLATLPFDEKRKLAKHLQKEVRKAHDLLAEADQVRRFLREENLATLRGWGRHPDSPVRVFIQAQPDGTRLNIGQSNEQNSSMKIPDGFWNILRSIPILGGLRSAAE